MKIIDCFLYFDEDMLLDIRLNILDKYVSRFVICEATFNHKGGSKKLNFDINKFSKFKDKIIYLPLENSPENLSEVKSSDTLEEKNSKILDNALIRENSQRNFLTNGLKKISDEELILVGDLDEIPNLNNFEYKKKITIFKQKMFFYKLNLIYPEFSWTGSKICKKKHLISPQWLRNIKSKKYPLWRFDALFSPKKYHNIEIIKDGGWHFTNIKSPENIDHKMKNFLHHLEYENSGMKIDDIKKSISEKKIIYDYFADKKTDKINNGGKLQQINFKELPDYIVNNKDKFKEWID